MLRTKPWSPSWSFILQCLAILMVFFPRSAECQIDSRPQGNTQERPAMEVRSDELGLLIKGKKVTVVLVNQTTIEGKVTTADEKNLIMRVSRSTAKGHVAGHETQVSTDDIMQVEFKKGRSLLSYALLIGAGTAISAYLGQSLESHARYIPLYASLGGSVALHASRPTIRIHVTPRRP